MRYFTPELFARFNSPADAVADSANKAWEDATIVYRDSLARFRDGSTPQVEKLAELCLHDAELAAFARIENPGEPMAILSLRQEDRIVTLIYRLWGDVRESSPRPDWPFSAFHIHWLYDEIDATDAVDGEFVHSVLLSDGRVIEIPFASVVVHEVPLNVRVAAST